MTKEARIPIFHIKHNQDVELVNGTVKEDKVYLRDKEQNVASFSNRGVFTVIDRRGKTKKRYKALFYLDGKSECVTIPEPPKEGEKYDVEFIEPLTNKDRKTIVKREIAKQLGRFRPIETWQFAVILIMLGISIGLNFIPGI